MSNLARQRSTELRQTAEAVIPLLLVGLACVQRCGDGDPAYPIVGCHYLKGVALLADGIAFAIEAFQQEPAYPNTRYLNVGEDVAGAQGRYSPTPPRSRRSWRYFRPNVKLNLLEAEEDHRPVLAVVTFLQAQ